MIALSAHLFPLLLIVAAAGDVLSRRISNRLVLLLALAFFPAAWAAGMPLMPMLVHAAAGLGLLALGFMLFSFGFMGGGDAKLLAGTGVWLGLESIVPFLTLTVIAGGLLAVILLVRHLLRPRGAKPSVPYGYAIAAGAILAFSDSWWGSAFTQ
jgi:prepilin peptidase CpaA